MTSRGVALALLIAAIATGTARPAQSAWVDPLLLPVLSEQAAPDVLGPAAVGVTGDTTGAEPVISVSLRVRGSIENLRATGIRFGGTLGDVATADVSLAQLRALVSHPSVLAIEAALPLVPNLNVSAPIAEVSTDPNTQIGQPQIADPFRQHSTGEWSDTSYTGRGVLIGIIDTGIDLRHEDFLNLDGTTRVVAVWDQSGSVGRPPRGFSYGAECTSAQINARDCPQVDRDGHGTHVAGIAAGNGSATSRNEVPYRYIGIAPEADLVVVKLRDLTSTRAIDALGYLAAKAVALGQPIVANLSLGSPLGPHDGTAAFDAAVDAFTSRGDGLGAAVVVSAGNDGLNSAALPSHAAGCFQAAPSLCPSGADFPQTVASPVAVSMVVPTGATRLDFDMWYSGNSTLGVTVSGPSSGCTTAKASFPDAPTVTAATPCGSITITAADANPANGDRRVRIVITAPSGIAGGIWNLGVSADALPAGAGARFDIWSAAQPSDTVPSFTTLGSPLTTIASPASAARAIAVVPFVSKSVWTSIDQSCSPCTLAASEGALHGLLTSSSRGPLRPCTNTANPLCTAPEQKPELAAPGAMIMSSFSSRVPDDPTLDKFTDPDRRHYALGGSSMAAPHATGAAALLLQINPRLTVQQIKTRLGAAAASPSTLTSPTPSPPYPVTQWGNGILAVRAAVDALTTAAAGDPAGNDPPPTAPADLRVTSVHSRRVALAWSPGEDLDLQASRAYRIFRRAENDPTLDPLDAITELPATATAFEDTEDFGLTTNEAVYFYSIQSVDMNDQLSPYATEVRGVPTAGEGSVGLCFIATAAYGSAWHPHVASLRAFRDRQLRPHAPGRAAIALYEAVSPPIAELIASRPALRAATRAALTPVVFAVEQPRAAAALAGIGLLGLAGLAFRRRSP